MLAYDCLYTSPLRTAMFMHETFIARDVQTQTECLESNFTRNKTRREASFRVFSRRLCTVPLTRLRTEDV